MQVPYQYDAAGNLTNDGSHSYTYDAEGRMIQVDGGSTAAYVYDAFGRRVKKTVAGYPTEYMYSLDGQIDSMMEGSAGHLTRGFVYLNGRPLVEYANGTTYFVHTDHLGSTRLLTNYPTPTIAESDDYYPFGEFNSSGSTSALKFTADERDSESGLDHTLFRQYSSSLGRWTVPDPAGLLATDASNPQSWNGYTYVQNNPLAFTDPLGLFTCGSIQVSCDTPPDPLAELDLCFFGFCGGNGSELPLIYRGGGSGGGNSGGPDVNKTWSKTFGCKANAQQLMSSVQNNMAQFADNRNTIFAANFPSRPIQPGGQYVIQPGLNPHTSDGYVLPTGYLVVTVTSRSASGWTFTTDPSNHYINGTVSFSAADAGNGNVTFSVTAQGNYSNFFWATLGKIIKAGENSTWNNMLNNVQNFCQSDTQVK